MPSLEKLMKRLGFVRLANYGLVLTPEGRIMSLRPAVLDDGVGGRIVGWRDQDLAAMELQKWEPARPAPQMAVATRPAVAPPPTPPARPAAIVSPVAPLVEAAGDSDEDAWEWEIALARARAAAEESEQAAASARAPRARPELIPPAPAPVEEAPKLVVKIPPPRPVTQPAATISFDDPTQVSPPPVPAPATVAKPTAVIAIPPVTRPAPPTIIPIPKLPSMRDRASQIQPVVNSNAAPARSSRTRLAKGTGPVARRAPTKLAVPPPPPIRTQDEPLPSARTVTLPSIKRIAR